MVTEKELFEALASRHTIEGQKKISRASVAICGLGGLGSNVAIHLARCGVGHLHLLDFDRVDLPNINRQQYRMDQIGTPKTEALRDELRDFAPYINIVTDQVKLTPENIPELLKDDEYIVEAFDKADQKAMLCNVVLEDCGFRHGRTRKEQRDTDPPSIIPIIHLRRWRDGPGAGRYPFFPEGGNMRSPSGEPGDSTNHGRGVIQREVAV